MSTFIKRTKSRNGSTVIQVVFKQGREVTKLVHIGTAHNEAEEAELRALANDVNHDGQLVLDLYGDGEPGLSMILESAFSATLWDALSYIYESIGIGAVQNETFKQLVLARIIEPSSKLDTIRILSELGAPTNTGIHRTLKKTVDFNYRDIISSACFGYTNPYTPSLLLYDVTTLYFEIQKEDDYRKVGLSKERRLDPQITLGLLVGRDGFPLEIKSFEGNRAEVKTIIEVLDSFKSRHGLEGLTVTADAAMLSMANIEAIKDAGYHFIIGSRIAKTPYEIAEYTRAPGSELEDGKIFDLQVDMNTGKCQNRSKRRVIYQYSKRRVRMDLINIDKLLSKAQKMLVGDIEYKRNRFLKVTGSKKEINDALVEESKLKAGIKGYVTDLDVPAEEVIDAYHQLFQVENSFRMTKSDLKARPVFHHERDSIEAHLTIVFAALAISRIVQAKTGVTIRKLLNTLKPVRTGRVTIAGKSKVVPPRMPPEAQKLLEKLYN